MHLEWLIISRYVRGIIPAAFFSSKSRISFVVMVVAIATIIIVLSIFNGFQVQMKKAIWNQGAHISLTPTFGGGMTTKYREEIDRILKMPINPRRKNQLPGNQSPGNEQPDAQDLEKGKGKGKGGHPTAGQGPKLKSVITKIHGAITSPALYVRGADYAPIEIRAVDVAMDKNGFPGPEIPNLNEYNRDLLKNFDGGNYVIVGSEFSKFYGPSIGQYIRLYVPRGGQAVKGGEFAVREFRIAATFKTNFYETDSRVIYMSLKTGQGFYSMPAAANKILMNVDSVENLRVVRHRIFQEVSGYRVEDIQSTQANLLAALKLEKTIISIILFLFVVLAAVGMVAIIYFQVRDKRKSLGIMRAIGLSSRTVLLVFTFNGLVLGLLASVIGGLWGIFLSLVLEDIIKTIELLINEAGRMMQGFAWQRVELIPKNIYYFDTLPVNIDLTLILLVTLAATILSGLAGYFPARWAAKLEPVETIRYE